MSSESTSTRMYPTWCPVCDYKRVTQLSPSPMCDSCWADKHSTQTIDGVTKPFKEVLKEKLIELDLWFKDGETRGEWQERIEVEGRSALQRHSRRKKG
jgi:hypothetical protein